MAFIPDHLIEEVRAASEIVSVVSDYVTLKKKGQNYFGLCPFHAERTGSFSVNPQKQIFHCFGCGTGGNVFTFIMREQGVSFPEAIRTLAKRAGIEIPEPDEFDRSDFQEREALYYANEMAMKFFQDQLFRPDGAGAAALAYMQTRGFDENGLREFGIGYAPDAWDALVKHAQAKQQRLDVLEQAGLLNKRDQDEGYYDRFRHRVMFPILNLSGKVIAFGGRRLVNDDKTPKYVNSPETPIYHKSNVLFGLFQGRDAIRETGEAVFVEGYTDVMRLALTGLRNVVATSGTALTELQARLIRRYTEKVTLLYDSDTAGAAATMRGADILVEQGLDVRVAEMTEGEDPDSFVRNFGAESLREKLATALPLLDFKALRIPATTGLEQTEQLRSLISTLARIQDGLQRQAMVRHYSEKMKLDEEILWEEVRKLRKLQRLRHRPGAARPEIAPPLLDTSKQTYGKRSRLVEEDLIRIMLLQWDAVPFVFSFMEVTDFFNDDFRPIATVLFQLYQNQIRPEPEELIHYFTDASVSDFVSRVVLNESPRYLGLTQDYRRWAADCLAKLQRLMLDTKIEEVRELLKDREKSGGDPSELTEAWRDLQEQRRRVRAENFLPKTKEKAK